MWTRREPPPRGISSTPPSPNCWGPLTPKNSRAIDRTGLREWQPVMTSDPRVNLKVPALRSVENYVRRGGQGGDILCFMPKSWVESRNRLKAQLVERRTEERR